MNKRNYVLLLAIILLLLTGCRTEFTTPEVDDISITYPGWGTVHYGEISVKTQVNNSSIKSIKLFVGSAYKSTLTTSPYTFALDTVPYNNSTISITVRGYDISGTHIASSNPVDIAIDSSSAPPE
ncbi:hypothetical protein KAR04_04185 [Candidatus Calescamantes bacterium]|nr:hypothetical protein [Candidatus Calescamantes bacterium]